MTSVEQIYHILPVTLFCLFCSMCTLTSLLGPQVSGYQSQFQAWNSPRV